MVAGKTKSGFEFEVNEKVIKSWEFTKILRMLKSADEGDQLSGAVDFVGKLLGDQEGALMEHLQDEDGLVLTSDVINEASEILNIVQEKNEEVKN